MRLSELKKETVYRYSYSDKEDSFYMFIHPTIHLDIGLGSQRINCLNSNYEIIEQIFSLSGNFYEVDQVISDKVKLVLGINKQFFPIY